MKVLDFGEMRNGKLEAPFYIQNDHPLSMAHQLVKNLVENEET